MSAERRRSIVPPRKNKSSRNKDKKGRQIHYNKKEWKSHLLQPWLTLNNYAQPKRVRRITELRKEIREKRPVQAGNAHSSQSPAIL